MIASPLLPDTNTLEKSSGKHVWLQPVPPTTPIFSIGDHTVKIGHFVHANIQQPELTLGGNYVFATTETTTLGEYLQFLGEITGKKTEYVQVSFEAYDRL